MNTRPHDPFSPHVAPPPPPVFVSAEQSAAERRDAALKELAIEAHAATPAKKPTGRPKAVRRVKPTKAQMQAAVADLKKPR